MTSVSDVIEYEALSKGFRVFRIGGYMQMPYLIASRIYSLDDRDKLICVGLAQQPIDEVRGIL